MSHLVSFGSSKKNYFNKHAAGDYDNTGKVTPKSHLAMPGSTKSTNKVEIGSIFSDNYGFFSF